MIRYGGVHHLAMATRDMDGTIRFWRDLLGMRLVVGMGRPGARHYFFQSSENQTFIAFFEWPAVQPVEEKDHGYPVSGPFVFDHVSLRVDSGEGLWELKERLEAAGFWVSEVIDHGFIHSVYSFDPNGIAIEFSHCVEEVDVLAHPVMIDTAPSEVTLEGPGARKEVWPAARQTPSEDRRVYPGEGRELVQGSRKNWFAESARASSGDRPLPPSGKR